MEEKEIFSKNLNLLMEINNVSRRELSSAIGVSYFTVTPWCNGTKYPRMDKVEILARFFGCSKSDLVEYKSKEQREVEALNKELTQLLTSLSLPEKKRVIDFIAGIKSSRK